MSPTVLLIWAGGGNSAMEAASIISASGLRRGIHGMSSEQMVVEASMALNMSLSEMLRIRLLMIS
jgi:hypothetical protein